MTPSLADGRCARCLWRACLCSAIPRLETRTRVVIVRHRTEAFRSSNTGRLAHLALANSDLVDYGGEHTTPMPPLGGAWLVFPEGEPMREPPRPPPAQLVVLDATWSQARRMFRKLEALRGLPILRLPDIDSAVPRLRAAPGPGRVSTIEAIAAALRLVAGYSAPPSGGAARSGGARPCEDATAAAELGRLFQLAVQRAQAAGRRTV